MRIALIDDHGLVRAGLESIVRDEPGWSVCWSGDNVQTYLAEKIPADVVLLDLDLNGTSAGASDVVSLVNTGAAVLVVSALASPHTVREIAQAGAAGFVSKADSTEDLPQAIRTVAGGDHWLTASTMQILIEGGGDLDPGLTTQERRVLELFSSGMTVGAIARLLELSPATVHVHLKRIRAKFAAVDRPAAGAVNLYKRAVEFGIAQSPERN